MDLSGQMIRGTGSYKVSEIAPPVESGQLSPNTIGDWIDSNGDAIPDDWTENVTCTKTITNGIWKGVRTTFSYYGLIHQLLFTVGRTYKVQIKVRGTVGKLVRVIDSGGIGNNSLALTADWTIYDTYITASTAQLYVHANNHTTVGDFFELDYISVEEVPEGYSLIEAGDKYLECTGSGTVAVVQSLAYGEIEFLLNKTIDGALSVIYFIADSVNSHPDVKGYGLQFSTSEQIKLLMYNLSTASVLASSATSYINIATWYRIKITRTLDGEFTIYIKGGAFGNDDWTVVSVTGGSGSNPVTDTTNTSSQYMVLDLDTGDRFIPGPITQGVIQ